MKWWRANEKRNQVLEEVEHEGQWVFGFAAGLFELEMLIKAKVGVEVVLEDAMFVNGARKQDRRTTLRVLKNRVLD